MRNYKIFLVPFFSFTCLLALTGQGQVDNDYNSDVSRQSKNRTFYAGASMRSITPDPNQIVGSRNVVSDSLYVRSLLLDDGNTKLLFVVLDVVGIDEYLCRVARERIYERTGIPKQGIMISATHTHSGLSLRSTGRGISASNGIWENWPLDFYQNFVIEQSVESAAASLKNMEPAQIGWGQVDVPEYAHNRRYRMRRHIWKTPWGDLENVTKNPGVQDPDIVGSLGPVDPEVSFISVQSISGRPMALFASYSPHYPADIPIPYISASYYGVFATRIKALLAHDGRGSDFVGAITIGTGGDLAAFDRRDPRPWGTAFDKQNRMGFDVARAVHGVYGRVEHRSWVKLDIAQSKLPLKVRKPTPQQLAYGEFLLERQQQGLPFLNFSLETNYAKFLNRLDRVWPNQIEMLLQVFRIGDLGIVAIPGEIFAETGLAIKEKSPFPVTYTNGMSNGSYGYLATQRQHKIGGYETWLGLSSRLEITAAEKIEREVLSLLRTLRE